MCRAAKLELPSSIAKLNGQPIQRVMFVMRLPDWIYKPIALRLKTTDSNYRSSMWADLDQRRATEVLEINGAIVRLGREHNIRTPMNDLMVKLVLEAQERRLGSPNTSVAQLFALVQHDPALREQSHVKWLALGALLALLAWYIRRM